MTMTVSDGMTALKASGAKLESEGGRYKLILKDNSTHMFSSVDEAVQYVAKPVTPHKVVPREGKQVTVAEAQAQLRAKNLDVVQLDGGFNLVSKADPSKVLHSSKSLEELVRAATGGELADTRENELLDKLSAENGYQRMSSGERVKHVANVVKNMTVDQINAKLTHLRSKPDKASKQWVDVYTEALKQKGETAQTELAAPFAPSEYSWHTYNAPRGTRLVTTNKKNTAMLRKGVQFGLRDATSKSGKARLITAEHGPNVVFTLEVADAAKLAAKALRVRGNKPPKMERVSARQKNVTAKSRVATPAESKTPVAAPKESAIVTKMRKMVEGLTPEARKALKVAMGL